MNDSPVASASVRGFPCMRERMIGNNRKLNLQSLPFSLKEFSRTEDLSCHLLSCPTLLLASQLT